MDAKLLMRDRFVLGEALFADIVVWQVPLPVLGSTHSFKYRLALVANELCILRYDNERGKGDHRHYGKTQESYKFLSPEQLINDFWVDIEIWRQRDDHSHS